MERRAWLGAAGILVVSCAAGPRGGSTPPRCARCEARALEGPPKRAAGFKAPTATPVAPLLPVEPPPRVPWTALESPEHQLARATARQREAEDKILDAPEPDHPLESVSPETRFLLIADGAVPSTCTFAGTPNMLCRHDTIERPKLLSDLWISAGCPVDVVVMGRQGQKLDWVIYAPAQKGAAVHGVRLPLERGRQLTIAASRRPDGTTPNDLRCGVTTIWTDAASDEEPPKERTEPLVPVIPGSPYPETTTR